MTRDPPATLDEPDTDCEVIQKLRAEIERLKAEREQLATDFATLSYTATRKATEIEQLKADHLSALQLSHEWMAKHDRLLAFIQSRPEMLTELIAEEPKP